MTRLPNMTPAQQRVLVALLSPAPVTAVEAAGRSDTTRPQAVRALNHLSDLGLVEAGDVLGVYTLTPAGRRIASALAPVAHRPTLSDLDDAALAAAELVTRRLLAGSVPVLDTAGGGRWLGGAGVDPVDMTEAEVAWIRSVLPTETETDR